VKYRPGLGLPQGLEVIGGEFLFSTTNFAGGAIIGNRVHVFDLKGGYKTYIDVPISRESEGLAINPTNNVLYLGFHKQNSVYVMSSAYHACPEAACFVRRMV
jgi:hypothetical protein